MRGRLPAILVAAVLLATSMVILQPGPADDAQAALSTPSSSLPTARSSGCAVSDGSRYIYYMGGMDSLNDHVGDIVRLDTVTGDVETLGAFPALAASAAVYVNGDIFVFGGMWQNGTISRRVYKYDISEQTVETVAYMTHSRMGLGAIFTGWDVFLFGGWNQSSFSVSNEIHVFKTESYHIGRTANLCAMPEPRTNALTVWTGTYAYILGGQDNSFTVRDTVFRFDPAQSTCLAIPHNGQSSGYDLKMARGAYLAGGAFLNGSIYIYGGFDDLGTIDKIQKVNPLGHSAGFDGDLLETPLSSICAVPLGGRVYLLGGQLDGGGRVDWIRIHDPSPLHMWETLHDYGQLPASVEGSVAVQAGPIIYIAGGMSGGVSSGQIYRYDPNTGRVASESALAASVAYASSVFYNDRIWVFGGRNSGVEIASVQYYRPDIASGGGAGSLSYPVQFAHAALYSHYAYIFGGFASGLPLDTVIRFDLDTMSSDVVGTIPYPVYEYGLAVDGDTAYLIGGTTTGVAYVDDIIEYDFETMTSTTHENVLPYTLGATTAAYCDDDGLIHVFGGHTTTAPTRWLETELIIDQGDSMRVDVGSVCLPDTLGRVAVTQGEIFLFGGWDGAAETSQIYEYRNLRFRPYDGHSYPIDYNLPGGLSAGGMAILGGIPYSFGGYTSTVASPYVCFVRPDNGLMYPIQTMPFPIYGSSAAAVGEYIYVFGGYAPGQAPTQRDEIWRFRYTGTAFQLEDTGLRLPSGRYFSSACTDGTWAYIVGGTTSGGYTNEIVKFCPGNGTISVSTMPVALRSPVVGCISGDVYIATGMSSSGPVRTLYKYDASARTTKLVLKMPMAVEGAAGGGGYGLLFVAGGKNALNANSDRVMVYDTAANFTFFTDFRLAQPLFRPISAMGFDIAIGGETGIGFHEGAIRTAYLPRAHTFEEKAVATGTMFSAQSDAGATYDGEDVYLFGGYTGTSPQTINHKVLAFDKDTALGYDTGHTLPQPMAYQAATYNTVTQKTYLFGGQNGGTYYDTIYTFDPVSGVNAYMYGMPYLVAKSGCGAFSVGGKAYVMAGRDTSAHYNGVYEYDVATMSGFMNAGALPVNAAYFGSGFDGECAYTFGGETNGGALLDIIMRYDPLTLNSTVMTAKLPFARIHCAAVYDPEAEVFVIFGGEGKGGVKTDQILFYDPERDILTIAKTKLPQPTSGMMAVYDETMALGGTASTGGLNAVLNLRYVPNAPTGSDYNSGNISGDITIDVTTPHVYYYNLKDTLTETSALNWQIEAGQSYFFELEAGHGSGYQLIDQIDIYAWFDGGSDLSAYNGTAGEAMNFHFRYRNSTATGDTAQFSMLWPGADDLGGFSATETNLPSGVANREDRKRFRFYFTPSYFMRWADGCVGGNNAPDFGDCWDTVSAFNDPDSWNFRISIRDANSNQNDTYDEFGVFKYQQLTVQAANPWLDGAPGMPWTQMETSDPGNITLMMTRMNAPFRLLVNITDLTGLPGTIGATHIGLAGGDIAAMTAFLGPGLANAQYPRGSAATWCQHDYAATEYGGWFFSILEWYGEIPAGTGEGLYEGGITYRTQTSLDPSVAYAVPNNAPEEPSGVVPGMDANVAGPDITFSVTVEDIDGDDLSVEFFIDGASFDIVNDVETGATASTNAALAGGPHTWYVVISDGITSTTSQVYSFTVV